MNEGSKQQQQSSPPVASSTPEGDVVSGDQMTMSRYVTGGGQVQVQQTQGPEEPPPPLSPWQGYSYGMGAFPSQPYPRPPYHPSFAGQYSDTYDQYLTAAPLAEFPLAMRYPGTDKPGPLVENNGMGYPVIDNRQSALPPFSSLAATTTGTQSGTGGEDGHTPPATRGGSGKEDGSPGGGEYDEGLGARLGRGGHQQQSSAGGASGNGNGAGGNGGGGHQPPAHTPPHAHAHHGDYGGEGLSARLVDRGGGGGSRDDSYHAAMVQYRPWELGGAGPGVVDGRVVVRIPSRSDLPMPPTSPGSYGYAEGFLRYPPPPPPPPPDKSDGDPDSKSPWVFKEKGSSALLVDKSRDGDGNGNGKDGGSRGNNNNSNNNNNNNSNNSNDSLHHHSIHNAYPPFSESRDLLLPFGATAYGYYPPPSNNVNVVAAATSSSPHPPIGGSDVTWYTELGNAKPTPAGLVVHGYGGQNGRDGGAGVFGNGSQTSQDRSSSSGSAHSYPGNNSHVQSMSNIGGKQDGKDVMQSPGQVPSVSSSSVQQPMGDSKSMGGHHEDYKPGKLGKNHGGIGGGGPGGGPGGGGDDGAPPEKKPKKQKRKRCGECYGCQRKDNCGDCAPCRNEKSHQICKMRRCEKLIDKKASAAQAAVAAAEAARAAAAAAAAAANSPQQQHSPQVASVGNEKVPFFGASGGGAAAWW